jgi:hypothetical protein
MTNFNSKIVLTMPIKDLKLELLRGEKGERDWVNSYANDLKKSSDEEFDDLFLEFGCKPCVGAFISGIR